MKPGTGSRIFALAIVFGLVGMALFALAFNLSEIGRTAPGPAIFGIFGEAAIFAMLAFGPIGRAIASLLEPQQLPDNQLLDRLTEIEYRLAEISGEVQRVNELDSRVEFAERMLARPVADQAREG